ncbi:MAG: hypothetical protein JEZ14_08045 [Marinilabiliaceae bacterium]|nr:hypothetical protein [Marinilabiliaceae bacterium]
MNKRVLFLTTANLSMKPRLVKEIQLARSMGFDVDLIAFKINNWTDNNHDLLAHQLKINHTTIYATRHNFLIWLISSVCHLIAQKLWPFFKSNLLLSAFASNKRTIMMWLYLLFHSSYKSYSWIIGRNTATIYPILFFKKRFIGSIGFDVEDYHPGERVSWCQPENEESRRKLLLSKIFHYCKYVSFAGEPIMTEAKKTFPYIGKSSQLINVPNSFSSLEFNHPENKTALKNKIELVWFSVDISANRGLEQLIEAIKPLSQYFHLTLYGTRIPSFYEQWIKPNQSFINIKQPVSQIQLHKELANYDVGLALEIAATDLNKQLAISNKLYAYAQAGLFIVATNTLAQQQFMEVNPGVGLICGQTANDMQNTLEKIRLKEIEIRNSKIKRFEKGKKLAWDKEANKLKDIWSKSSLL